MRIRARHIALGLVLMLVPVGIALAQPLSGIVRPTTEPPRPSLHLGAELFAGNCASCHGIAGAGITSPRPGAGEVLGAGPSLHGVGAQAADFYLRLGLMPLTSPQDEPTRERVLFSDKEIRSLVQYVASLGSGPGVPRPNARSGSLPDGLRLFTEHCAGCHQIAGRGGFVTGARVPPLQGLTATEIAEAVRVGPYLMPQFTPKQISKADLNSLVRYVLSTNHPDNHGGWGIGNLGPIPEGIVVWWIAGPLLIGICVLLGRRMRS
ncbi:MAG TPA: c-type cytochrome [Solirubrobacteraceae bacterium]|jgi:ubiquinol-cytochrome c reductase cytochrome c subunit